MKPDNQKGSKKKKRGIGCLTVIVIVYLAFSLTTEKAKDLFTAGSAKKIISSSYSREKADKLFHLCTELGLNPEQSIKALLDDKGAVVSVRQKSKGESRLEYPLFYKILTAKQKNIHTTYELKGCIEDFPEEHLELSIFYKAKERKFIYFRSASLLELQHVEISTALLNAPVRLTDNESKEFVPMLLLKGGNGYINSIVTKPRIALCGASREITLKAIHTAGSASLLVMARNSCHCGGGNIAIIMDQLKTRKTVENQKLLRELLFDPFISVSSGLKPYHETLIAKADDPDLLLDIATGCGDIDPQHRISALNKILSPDTCIKVLNSSVHDEVKLVAAKHLKDEQLIFDEIMKESSGRIVLAQLASQLKDQSNLFSVATKYKNKMEVENAAVEQMDDDHLKKFILKWSLHDVNDWRVSHALAQIDDPKNIAYFVSDPTEQIGEDTRFAAVKWLTDQGELEQIACSHAVWPIREIAVKKLVSQEVLARIVLTDDNSFVRKAAADKISDPAVAFKIYERSTRLEERVRFLKMVDDEELLFNIFNGNESDAIKAAAIHNILSQEKLIAIANSATNCEHMALVAKKITDQDTLRRIVLDKNQDFYVKKAALENLMDEPSLCEYVLENSRPAVSCDESVDAVAKINRPNLLVKIILAPINNNVRIAAIRRISDAALLRSLKEKVDKPKVQAAIQDQLNRMEL